MSEGEESRKVRKTGSPGRVKKSEVSSRESEEESTSAPDSYRDDIPKSVIKKELQTENHPLPTEKMEVHHHPQLEHKPKPWKEYLLEGFMIFLAVFMGFIAENIREGYGDRAREGEYIHSIVEDIKSDTAQSTKVLIRLNKTQSRLDTLLNVLASEEIITNSNAAYRLWGQTLGFADFISNDRTIQQLKNNGGLRLIRNKAVSDSIMQYDQTIKNYYGQADLCNRALTEQTVYGHFFDFIAIHRNGENPAPVPLPEEGKKILNEAFSNRRIQLFAISILAERLKEVHAEGKRVITFIKQQYDTE